MNASVSLESPHIPYEPEGANVATAVVPRRRYRIASGVTVHPVPRLNMCLVRAPNAQTVHTLNRSAWRLLELCALGDEQRMHSVFVNGSGNQARIASEKFERVLGELVARRLVMVDELKATR